MRLLYVCSDFGIPPDGKKGASVHLRAITRALAGLGHDVRLLSPKAGPGGDHPARRLLDAGFRPADECTALLKRFLLDHGWSDALSRELRPLLFSASACVPALAALRAAPPDAIIERLSLLSHVGVDLAESLNVPLIVEVNALLTEESRAFRALQLQELAENMERRVLTQADAVVVVSEPLAIRVAALGVDPRRVHVVPNGADLELFEQAPPRDDCRRELGLDDDFAIGFVGSLKVWHGVDVLLHAFAALLKHTPGVKLVVVGTGPVEADLHALAQRLNIQHAVVFTGGVAHERVPSLLRALDVAVAPFKPVDQFYFSPIKLFEYMAAGACVVASRLGQIEEVVEHGVSGLLCTPDDPVALHDALEVLRISPRTRAQLVARAAETVRDRFTWRHAAESVASIVQDAIGRRCSTPADPMLEVA